MKVIGWKHEKKEPVAPMLKSFPRIAFFTQFFKWNIKYEAEYDIYMIKIQFVFATNLTL
jgi:hypothetical protein